MWYLSGQPIICWSMHASSHLSMAEGQGLLAQAPAAPWGRVKAHQGKPGPGQGPAITETPAWSVCTRLAEKEADCHPGPAYTVQELSSEGASFKRISNGWKGTKELRGAGHPFCQSEQPTEGCGQGPGLNIWVALGSSVLPRLVLADDWMTERMVGVSCN